MSAETEMSGEEKKGEPATLQVRGEDVKLNMSAEASKSEDVDVNERDPLRVNDHVKVRFQEIFAEPDTEVYSFDTIWIWSYKVFTNTKLWCYRITTLILGLPLALCWGVCFACISFCNIWVYMPCLRCHDVECLCLRRVWEILLGTFVGPCFEAMGRVFSGFVIRLRRD